MASPLFSGPSSLRHPRERLAFVGTLLWALPAAAALGFFIHQTVGINQVALFIVIAMVYITLARGRLIGSSVMIHEAQYPRVFAIVKKACAALEIPMPLVFVREDMNVAVVALGFGEPYSLVVSSHYIEEYRDDELAFMIGRQLGHIAAGHTRYLSLLSVNGNENAIISLIFGPWLRICELTCDKVGLIVCGSLDAAARAIAVTSFHHFGRHVNVQQFAEQGREIAGDSILRWGEWLGSEPYATRRIEEMRVFAGSQQYATLEEWYLREQQGEPPALPSPGTLRVSRDDCAGWWRRATAVAIDAIVVTSLIGALAGQQQNVVHVDVQNTPMPAPSAAPTAAPTTASGKAVRRWTRIKENADESNDDTMVDTPWFTVGFTGIHAKPGTPLWRASHLLGSTVQFWVMAIYEFVLVGLAGQTFGMMITGQRVVTLDFRRPGIGRAFLRYGIAFVLWPIIVMLSVVQHRVMLHDRLSKTRLITSERAMARAASTLSPATATG